MRATEQRRLLIWRAGSAPCGVKVAETQACGHSTSRTVSSRTVTSRGGSQQHWHQRRRSRCLWIENLGAHRAAQRWRDRWGPPQRRRTPQSWIARPGQPGPPAAPPIAARASSAAHIGKTPACRRPLMPADINANVFVFELHLLGVTLRTAGHKVSVLWDYATLHVSWRAVSVTCKCCPTYACIGQAAGAGIGQAARQHTCTRSSVVSAVSACTAASSSSAGDSGTGTSASRAGARLGAPPPPFLPFPFACGEGYNRKMQACRALGRQQQLEPQLLSYIGQIVAEPTGTTAGYTPH